LSFSLKPDLSGYLFLLQVDDTQVISFLLSTEIIPLCLKTMEMGSELSKTVSSPCESFEIPPTILQVLIKNHSLDGG